MVCLYYLVFIVKCTSTLALALTLKYIYLTTQPHHIHIRFHTSHA